MAEAVEEKTEEKFKVPAKFEKLVGEIDKLSVLELSELVKVLEKHYGVSAAAPVAVAAGPAAGADDAPAAEEKSTFTVVLAAAGDQKINVIKAVREALPSRSRRTSPRPTRRMPRASSRLPAPPSKCSKYTADGKKRPLENGVFLSVE